MQGVVFLGERQLELREFPDPQLGPGEVIVAIKASGLCGSDLHRYRAGAMPEPDRSHLCIVGHEPAGVVEAVGPGVRPEEARIGDRVMINHYSGCNKCQQCRSGWPQMCTTLEIRLYGTNENGSHAPYMRVPASTLVNLDESLSFEAGAAIGCGTGTAWGGLERLGDVGGADMVIFGQGPVGLSATMLANARGARVIAVDLSRERLERAALFGAAEVIDPSEVDASATVRELTAGAGAALALETSGSSIAAASMLASLRPWGKACFIGLGGKVEFDVFDYLQSQLTLMTSWSMSIVDQSRCATFIAKKGLPIDDLFSHRWSLEEAEQAYVEFDKQTAGKGVFLF
ncbi:MAG: iditol 2-dehydrogenase [Microbacteriaceae bacterium]|nr:MAG: iditol 2-dehydrogenase [Microbacteriaceae bacterium]